MAIPASRTLAFSEIPLIDIGPLVAKGADNAPEIVAAIRKACMEVGFMQLINHGVPRPALNRLYGEAQKFFNLPVEERMKVAMANSPYFRGYLPLKYEGDEYLGTNLQEAFNTFHERPIGANPVHGPNQWPAAVPGLKDAMMSYFAECEKLAYKLLPAFALALGLKSNHFDAMFREPLIMLKLNHYPLQEKPEHENEIGVVGHTDSGCFTILWQDNNGGLEVQNKAGEWVGVPPIDGAYVINLGRIMQILSNGMFSATEHRVINRTGADRYSIPMFVNPSYNTTIKPLVGDPPADFKPFLSGHYQEDVYRRTYPHKKLAA
ncbi:MAG: isopenicillin N synthase family oxygenase [Alphaproteobacteria bacterium]|nr:isopenicillin N synthase family oxygenase [Alphaproteobacteria bacterium]